MLENIEWAGRPDIKINVFQDQSPFGDGGEITQEYNKVIDGFPWVDGFYTTVEWGCMQGVANLAMHYSSTEWVIWIPDDVLFTRGGLWNEYAGVLAYGRPFVAALQAPYWNAHDLVDKGLLVHKDHMWSGWQPENIPHNPHWDGYGLPRMYVNANGAGFSLNREFWKLIGGFPKGTWRFDEYLGVMAWKHGSVILTVPGPPRVHYFGGTSGYSPTDHRYHTQEAFEEAIGMSLEEANTMCRAAMAKIPTTAPDGCFNDVLRYYANS